MKKQRVYRLLALCARAECDATHYEQLVQGAALSHLVYPEPGLRPMSDLDILVPRSEIWRAGQILAE